MAGYIIVFVILITVALILFMPVSAEIIFDELVFIRVKLYGITVFKFSNEKTKKKKTAPKKAEKKEKKKKEKKSKPNFFDDLKRKYGFSGAVFETARFIKNVLIKSKTVFSHFFFKKIILDMSVAADDAAGTALQYGKICSVVFPLISLIKCGADPDLKQINISPDFSGAEPYVFFSGVFGVRIIFLIIFAVKAVFEFLKFKKQIGE